MTTIQNHGLCEAWKRLDGDGGKELRSGNGATLQEAIADALSKLLNEVLERKYLVEGNPFVDPEVRGWRYTIILGAVRSAFQFDNSASRVVSLSFSFRNTVFPPLNNSSSDLISAFEFPLAH